MVRRARAGPEPRKRRTAEAARSAILDVAERRLIDAGPAGIRLQEVAQEVGMSHPTVLHHFGSREALVKEVCARRFAALHSDLLRAITTTEEGPESLERLVDSVATVLEAEGHGRMLFWLALEGMLDDDGQRQLHALGVASHALRRERRAGKSPPLEDTLRVVALASLALLGESVLGPAVLRDSGLGTGAETRHGFRRWLARLLADHLAHGPRPLRS